MKIDVGQVKITIDQNLNSLRETYRVKNIGIFGSVARGQNQKSSDIDLLVEFLEPVGFFKFIQLENYLSKIIGQKVDLVTKNALKPAIKKEVLQDIVYV